MTREIRLKVIAVRWHPRHDHKIQVEVDVPQKGGGLLRQWYTPHMRYITRTLRLSLASARNPDGGFEYMERVLVGQHVPIPALQHEARGAGVKVDKLKPREKKWLR